MFWTQIVVQVVGIVFKKRSSCLWLALCVCLNTNSVHAAQFFCFTEWLQANRELSCAFKHRTVILSLTLVIVSVGHDLHSILSFAAKQRSALPKEAPNKDRGNGNPPE